MTPEYQAILLNQLVGTVEEQQGSNEPQFSDATITTTSLATYISDAGHTGNLQFRFYVSRNNYFLLFYNEYDSSNNWKASFVVVTDEALNPIDIIESYYSGTHFTAFQQGSRNDTGEGRIFFVSQNRLYYVNDPTAKSPSQPFEMRILNSYELQLGSRTLLSFKKNENGGNFVFASVDYSNYHIFITEFVNNVGFPSEWNNYEYNFNEYNFSSSLDFYPLWKDTFSCEVVYNTIDTSDDLTKIVKVLNTNSNGLYLVKTIRTEVDTTFSSSNATLISYNKFAYVALEGIAVENTPVLENPVFTSKFTDINGKSTQVDFVEKENSEFCYVFVNEEYTGTFTSSEFINGDDSVSYAFDLFCKQAEIEK
jgi:hypothetical protein